MNLTPRDYKDKDSDSLIADDLVSTGFSVIYNHPISKPLIDDLFYEWDAWFNTYPASYKKGYIMDKKTQSGWFPMDLSESAQGSDFQDLKEYFQYFKGGKCPAYCEKSTGKYFDLAHKFLAKLLDEIIVALRNDRPQIFNHLETARYYIKDCESHLLRILHYPPLDGQMNPNAIRAAEHTDINLLTMLPASNARGLQVKLDNGDWEDVPIDGDYLIINAGDTLSLAADHQIKSGVHRVINPDLAGEKNISRFSVPFFLHARPSAVIHNDMTARQILNERLRELGVI